MALNIKFGKRIEETDAQYPVFEGDTLIGHVWKIYGGTVGWILHPLAHEYKPLGTSRLTYRTRREAGFALQEARNHPHRARRLIEG